jgi:hypothetical protein
MHNPVETQHAASLQGYDADWVNYIPLYTILRGKTSSGKYHFRTGDFYTDQIWDPAPVAKTTGDVIRRVYLHFQ